MTILARKYVQFNDLVIDNYNMLTSASLSGGFKTSTAEFSFGHGSYVPFKAQQQLLKEQNLSMTLKLDTRKLSFDQKKFYKDYVFLNILKSGKIWAIEGEQLLWANAYVSDFSEEYSTEKNVVSIDIDLILYDGYWHKADIRKVFLQPYSSCNFADCLDFRELADCNDDERARLKCCKPCVPTLGTPEQEAVLKECPKCSCGCEGLTRENSLCELNKEMAKEFYKQCGDAYRIVYNCEAGARIFGKEKMLGDKFCKTDTCKDIIAGKFYSDTVVDTENVTVTLIGSVSNPTITINGNSMQVIGDYDGELTINSNGEISNKFDDDCPAKMIDINKLVIPTGNTLGFSVHHGNNSLVVETGTCSMVCAYLKIDSLTI